MSDFSTVFESFEEDMFFFSQKKQRKETRGRDENSIL
jgi:hypothetical protein